jgi:restriction system protein
MNTVWGIHNDELGAELFEQGFVSIGFAGVGDMRQVGNDREKMKLAVQRANPFAKAGAIPVWAGVALRFAFEMKVGDYVIAPFKRDSTLNFGVVTGDYEFHADVPVHKHRRAVRWFQTGVARAKFPKPALYEIGSALTMFQVKKHVDAFLPYFSAGKVPDKPAPTPVVDPEEWVVEEPNAEHLEQYTRDFVLKTLLEDVSHAEFEQFTADLLQALGYQARVTQYVGDGGVDVIAHKDALGLEPPRIKVQCKHTAATIGSPAVQNLVGTLASGTSELGLFVTLGTYSAAALELERARQNLRLLTGNDVVTLVLDNYLRLPRIWRERLPLRQVYVVDTEMDD